jgi:hypothetical protein
MIVVHFAKVSTLYPHIVISSLIGRLENLLFAIFYTSFGVWPRDHYMPLQMFTMGRMPSFLSSTRYHSIAKVSWGSTRYDSPTCTMLAWANDHATFHSSEQGTRPTTSLFSKQAIPYRTHGDTCCPEVSTHKIWSLADSSMTNHISWRSQPSPPFQSLLKWQHRTSPRSPHITTDGRPTLSTLNTSQTQHHKDRKTCMMTQDCRAKQYY